MHNNYHGVNKRTSHETSFWLVLHKFMVSVVLRINQFFLEELNVRWRSGVGGQKYTFTSVIRPALQDLIDGTFFHSSLHSREKKKKKKKQKFRMLNLESTYYKAKNLILYLYGSSVQEQSFVLTSFSGIMLWNSFSKHLKIKMYKTIILPFVLYDCEAWSFTLREECKLNVFENRILRRVFVTTEL